MHIALERAMPRGMPKRQARSRGPRAVLVAPAHGWRRRCTPLVLVLAALSLPGCAVTRVDAQGQTHIAGLVWMTLPAPDGPQPGARVVRMRTLGLSVNAEAEALAVLLGFGDVSRATIFNNSAVDLSLALTRRRKEVTCSASE